MELKIVKGKIEDLDEIDLLVKGAVKKMHEDGNFQWGELYPLRKDFKRDIENQDLYKALNEAGKIVGIASMNTEESEEYKTINWSSEKTAYVLHRLIIHPDYQKQGIGLRLTQFFHQQAGKKGYENLRLDAYSKNEGANKLYKKLGYQCRGQVYFRGLEAAFNCYERV